MIVVITIISKILFTVINKMISLVIKTLKLLSDYSTDYRKIYCNQKKSQCYQYLKYISDYSKLKIIKNFHKIFPTIFILIVTSLNNITKSVRFTVISNQKLTSLIGTVTITELLTVNFL